MNRTGLVIALAVAAVGGLIFGLFPQLDIAISRYFFDRFGGQFPKPGETMEIVRNFYSLLIAALVMPAFFAILIKVLRPRLPIPIPGRAVVFLIATIALGPGLMTNVIFKDHWGRARPYAVSEFRGAERFTPWWDPRGACTGNCSFIAGEPSGAFWTFAPAAVLVPAPYRVAAYAGAAAFGAIVGVGRVAYGAHFFSDVIFAGVFMFLLVWVMHGLIYRWPATRLSDRKIEKDIAELPSWFGPSRRKRRAR